jgi:hypothetical protein
MNEVQALTDLRRQIDTRLVRHRVEMQEQMDRMDKPHLGSTAATTAASLLRSVELN